MFEIEAGEMQRRSGWDFCVFMVIVLNGADKKIVGLSDYHTSQTLGKRKQQSNISIILCLNTCFVYFPNNEKKDS